MKKLLILVIALIALPFPALAETNALNDAEIAAIVLVVNQADNPVGAVVIVNPTAETVDSLTINTRVGDATEVGCVADSIPPFGVRKSKFVIRSPESPTSRPIS